MGISIALYSHDSVGLGHARRNRALAWALSRTLPKLTGEEVTGMLIAGHPNASQDSLPHGWDWLLLPGYARTSGGYEARSIGMSAPDLADMRGEIIASALDAFAPDLFIADRHAFGVDSELKQALAQLRQNHGTATVLGLRDVLDTPSAVHGEWEKIGGAAEVAAHYDALWVYGDRDVYDPTATGEIPAALAELTRFTGLLSRGRPEDEGAPLETPYILTSVGGGSDGVDVLLASAAAPVPAGHRHIIVTGPQMPAADVARVRDAVASNPCSAPVTGAEGVARPGIEVRRAVGNLPALLTHAAATVCMGGYNSTAEVLATDTPALVVPRASRRAEQPRRAAALAAADAVDTVSMAEVSAAVVGDWLADAVTRRVERAHLDLDGLAHVGLLAADVVRSCRARHRAARAVRDGEASALPVRTAAATGSAGTAASAGTEIGRAHV